MLNSVAFSDVRALKPSRLMRIDPADFHAIVAEASEAGAMLAQSLARRVGYLSDAYSAANYTQVTLVGDRYDLLCHGLRDFLSRNQITFEWLDPSDDGDVAAIPPAVQAANKFPALILADHRVLYRPTHRELAQALGLQVEPQHEEYDVVIIGGGPTGLAAAVYGGSEGLRTMMIEREAPGGQAGTSSRIENYLGFPGGITGGDLASRALQQAKRFGTEILVTRSVTKIEPSAHGHEITLDCGMQIKTKAVVVATGVTWRTLETPGAKALAGRGVYYGAAHTEALGTRGKDIFLIGGGNSAGQAAMFFSSYARSVSILIRGASLEKSMSQYLIEQLRSKNNIRVEPDTTVVDVCGGAHIESICTKLGSTGAVTTRAADGLFVFIGADAQTQWLPEELLRDGLGYICTGRDIENSTFDRVPFPLETSIPGIFAAGDVRSGSVKRVASGVGEGSMVISFVHQYLELTREEVALV